MGTSQRFSRMSRVLAAELVLCLAAGSGALAQAPAGTEPAASTSTAPSDAQASVPAGSFFSSLKQAFKQDLDREVVRGHFDVGSAPDAHRYYCLVDPKTGKRETYGVAGKPALRKDGMTGIKEGAVAPYSCITAEQQGSLVTSGYLITAGAGRTIAPPPTLAPPSLPPPPLSPSPQQRAAAEEGVSTDKIDVAGVKLGMSPDQVRAVLKSKSLLDYYESTEMLSKFGPAKGAVPAIGSGRFLNVIAAWTPPSTALRNTANELAESYEVMFTPVPGKERVMAIIHTAAYSQASAVREMALEKALVVKYGGYAPASELPQSATWRFQSGGGVQVGDPCNRRGIVGGLGEVDLRTQARQNIALNTTPEEFRTQIERCGVAIVTEDHSTANADAAREVRVVRRFTVTAYSPLIGLEGATTAAQLTRVDADATAPKPAEKPAPNL